MLVDPSHRPHEFVISYSLWACRCDCSLGFIFGSPVLLPSYLWWQCRSCPLTLIRAASQKRRWLLAWRLDRRQSRETELRIAQLQIEVERSRQIKSG